MVLELKIVTSVPVVGKVRKTTDFTTKVQESPKLNIRQADLSPKHAVLSWHSKYQQLPEKLRRLSPVRITEGKERSSAAESKCLGLPA